MCKGALAREEIRFHQHVSHICCTAISRGLIMRAGGRTSKRLTLAALLAAPAILLALAGLLIVMAAATGAMPVNLSDLSFYFARSQDASQGAATDKLALPKEIIAPSDPAVLRPLSRQDAAEVNAAISFSADANPAASRFMSNTGDVGSWARSLECLTAAVYYEAASETVEGQRAVAQVVLNRVRHPAYPHTVCGVVFQGSERKTGCQFTFTCDGSLGRMPSRSGWARAQGIAGAALGGYVFAPVGWSTHYHTDWVVPYWASTLLKTAVVGAHIFYRWDGGWGRPRAFMSHYAGVEPALDWREKGDVSNGTIQTKTALSITSATPPITPVEDRPMLSNEASHVAPRISSPYANMQPGHYIRLDGRRLLGGVQSSEDVRSLELKNIAVKLVAENKPSTP